VVLCVAVASVSARRWGAALTVIAVVWDRGRPARSF
jgi:hypothetical protein